MMDSYFLEGREKISKMNDVLAGVWYSLIYRAVGILKHFWKEK